MKNKNIHIYAYRSKLTVSYINKTLAAGILSHDSQINTERIPIYISHNQGIIRRNTDLYGSYKCTVKCQQEN